MYKRTVQPLFSLTSYTQIMYKLAIQTLTLTSDKVNSHKKTLTIMYYHNTGEINIIFVLLPIRLFQTLDDTTLGTNLNI